MTALVNVFHIAFVSPLLYMLSTDKLNARQKWFVMMASFAIAIFHFYLLLKKVGIRLNQN